MAAQKVMNASMSSSERQMTWPVRPWRVAFMRVRCLASGDLGPVERLALARLAASCASEMQEMLEMLVVAFIGYFLGSEIAGGWGMRSRVLAMWLKGREIEVESFCYCK